MQWFSKRGPPTTSSIPTWERVGMQILKLRPRPADQKLWGGGGLVICTSPVSPGVCDACSRSRITGLAHRRDMESAILGAESQLCHFLPAQTGANYLTSPVPSSLYVNGDN